MAGSPATHSQRWNKGWRRSVLASGMLVYPVVTGAWIEDLTQGPARVVGLCVVGLFCACYILAITALAQYAWIRLRALLAVLSLLFLAALPFARGEAFYLVAVIAPWAAGLLRRRAPVIVAASVAASLLVPLAVRSWHSGPGWLPALSILFTALTVYSSFENADAYRALSAARAEVAHLASEAERNRVARDLHDLLGHSLTAITVKSGLARKLAAVGSPLAVAEIAEVERLARQAVAEVRVAIYGFREMSLAVELARGRELLTAVGVVPDLPDPTDEVVDHKYQELFAWAVREGLTNVARHARAYRCTVVLTANSVEIRDDGVGGLGGRTRDGHGLAGLRERVADFGGCVQVGPQRPRGWRLRVSLDDPTEEP